MKRKNGSRYSLFTSVLALVLCLSMLVGTTFAWFTDEVVSGKNMIAAGNLDVELFHSSAAVTEEQVQTDTKLFMDLEGNPILWEPGVVSYENLRVVNAGDLALTYQMVIATANENHIVDGNAQYGLSQILKVGVVEGGITATDRAGVVASVSDANWTTLENFLRDGSLLPAGEQTWGVVIYWQPGENDDLWNLNNGKQLDQGETLQIDLSVKLIATQEMEESDSFNKEYDENAKAEFFPGFQGGSAGAVVTTDDQGVTTAQVAMSGGDVSAVIPAGVQVAQGVSALGLSVTRKESSEANVQLSESDQKQALDVHIEGVAVGNTVPMVITLKNYLSTGINTGALKLYHVENGTPVAMTQVAEPANHNEFSYDPVTGDLTLAMASFSEVAVVADTNNTWDGTVATAFAGGTGTEADPYLITNADQLAYLRNEVDRGRTFANEFIKLENNITLSKVNFDPIGWGYEYNDWNVGDVAGKPFKGTFDGGRYDENGKLVGRYTIFDLYQNGWDLEAASDMDYTYTNCGFGLFAAASGATFMNLTISGADIKTECVEMGVLVGLSQGSCTYENIQIHNSKIANYQRPTGGLIGEVSPLNGGGETKITDVTIGSDVVVGSLWGDFDAPCGGVIGARWDDSNTTTVYMKNVTVGCRMDVYSDVTSAYQWYAYRRAGMLMGNTEQTAENNQHLAAARFLTCEDVKVYYGDWAAYHYCQFTNQSGGENTDWQNNYPWVRVEAGENNSAYSNPRYGHPIVNGVAVTGTPHTCTEHNTELRFNQLYGGGQGVYGQPAHDGVEVINYQYSITYMNDYDVLAIRYITANDAKGKVETKYNPAKDLVEKWATENIKGAWEFGGWMNAGSTKVPEIEAGNKKNIVLYPYFNNPYTARFVDLQGNVIAYCFFHEEDVTKLKDTLEEAKAALPAPDEEIKLTGWKVRYINEDGEYGTEDFDENKFKSYKYDVTVYPVYEYCGKLNLVPVDEDGDGDTDYYRVEKTEELSDTVTVPGYVAGVQVKIVDDLCDESSVTDLNTKLIEVIFEEGVEEISAKSLAYTAKLSAVSIPKSVTKIGDNAFATAIGVVGSWVDLKQPIIITYAGTREEWDAIQKTNKWDDGMVKGSEIVCKDGKYVLKSNTFNNANWSWQAN